MPAWYMEAVKANWCGMYNLCKRRQADKTLAQEREGDGDWPGQ